MAIERDKLLKIINKGLEWTIYLMLFSLPFSKSIIEICVSIGIVLFILKRILIRDFSIPKTTVNIPLLFIFLTAAVSLFNSQYIDLSLRALFSKNLKFIVLYFIVIEAIDDRTKLLNLLKITAVSAFIMFTDTLIQYFVTHVDLLHNYPSFKYRFAYHTNTRSMGFLEYFIGYPTGPFPFPNDLSAWILIVMPPAIFLSLMDLKSKKISRILVSIFSALALYIFILAKARGAWIGFILSVCSVVFFIKKKLVLLLLAITFIIGMACFFRTPEVIFGLSSTQDRGGMWATGMRIFKEHPIIGNGINTFFNKYKEARSDKDRGQRGSYAHNCYLQMASDTGVLGLAAFLWFILAVIIKAIKSVKIIKNLFFRTLIIGLAAGICGFLIHSFFDTNLYSLNLASLFWISMGVLAATINIARTEER